MARGIYGDTEELRQLWLCEFGRTHELEEDGRLGGLQGLYGLVDLRLDVPVRPDSLVVSSSFPAPSVSVPSAVPSASAV